ncbi:MAG TPA: ATP-binding protein [Actinomycetota bacterium]|nr:ATP-binding protein [Actinomycetota bacterium]
MRPLDKLSSIKVKLGVVIVAAVAMTIVVNEVGFRLSWPLWVRAVTAGALALGMVQFLARGMTSPLREMAAATRAMAKGEYDRRVTASSRDEVGELARAFNRMASDLAEIDRVRRDLIANVSHELRTPISALQAVLENLVDGVAAPETATLESALGQVERLGRLVTQLLDLSRLESGVSSLQQEIFEVRPLLVQAVEEARVHAERGVAKDVSLKVDVAPTDLRLTADPERVYQIASNLLTNALRHSPADGEVIVRARGSSRNVVIEVLDQGPGIPEDEATRVFERFYRSDAARSSSDGGTGLGLAIARWIVDLHGGDIRVETAQPHGCRMVVELPQVAA